ncbi:hypothetical protein [Polyangium spumosum]|uniref:Uncharacterized protein n=1 Tax=Polyangium spumosum TaxID=889282 RepID=A0A6N7PQA0_9BACT|nr:hypothetical protein [Polyangium spumosum]MRG92986.1 hypothetical protein [Polyangium spumosum]
MLALDDAPTPAPMGDPDDECATQVWKGSSIGAGGARKEGARASTPSGAVASDSRASSTGAPAQSKHVSYGGRVWARLCDNAQRFADAMAYVFFGTPCLSKCLPPVPPLRSAFVTQVSHGVIPDQEYAEYMLLSLVRAPRVYQRAAVEVAHHALVARRDGDTAYMDFVVHFALSRMAPDREGRVTTERLRDRLCHMSYAREIAPALIRLEQRGLVALLLQDPNGDPMREILREGIIAVELRCQP